MSGTTETLQGYVVDIACLRKYPKQELINKARAHTRTCSLVGHCAESGFGLVTEEGYTTLLDPKATPSILDAVRQSDKGKGIRLEVKRTLEEGEMVTESVKEIYQSEE